MEFSNKVVAITGASGGIGQELCRHFGGQGAAIAAVDRSEALTAFASRLRSEGIAIESAVVDIGEPEPVASAFARFADVLGPIDILINNAGASSNPILEMYDARGFQR